MSADPDRLDGLAESVMDGQPVDWPGADSDAQDEDQRLRVAVLQDVSRIVEFHRELQRTRGAAPATKGFASWIKPEDLPPGLFRWGHLEALELVGRGSFGEVYRAIDTHLQREVALKLRRIESATTGGDDGRFLTEARDLARVRHPNVIVVYGADTHDGQIGFWTDFIHGKTLAAYLADHGSLDGKEATLVGLDLCRALGAVHAAGLVHGDVKATNAMREESGRIVLMDFGAARHRGEEKQVSVFASPLTTAPEVLAGEAPRPAADLYSLGALLYQLVSGRTPFEARTIPELRAQHAQGRHPSLGDVRPDLPAAFVAVVECTLNRDPDLRYHSAAEMEAALRAAMSPLQRKRHSLPAEPDRLIGRDKELAELKRNFQGDSRLVTLLGAGGLGKTRLAMRYGWLGVDNWPGGVWFCDLSEAKSLDGIASSVAGSLAVPLGKDDPIEQLGRAIAARQRCLVVLDNFEQVVDLAGATVSRWIEQAPAARFLVTSRERLRVPGETVQVVEPLSLEAGVVLFGERARQQHARCELEGPAAESVRELVKLVEGIPLAVELAAARITVMAPAQMVGRMRDRFRVLGRPGTGRHSTLEATIDGSWELLQPWEKAAFAQCSVFQGSFTLEAAENVLDLSAWPEAPWIVDVVQSLADQSLLRTLPAEDTPAGAAPPIRFAMFASLQEYARAKLCAGGAAETHVGGVLAARAIEERHGRWYARFGSEETIESLNCRGGADQRTWVPELDNLITACRSAAAREDGATAVATYRAVATVLEVRGPFKTAVNLGEEVLRGGLSREMRAVVLGTLARSLSSSGKVKEARAHYEEALAIHRESGNRRREGYLLGHRGYIDTILGRMEEARAECASALAIHREDGNLKGESLTLSYLGVLHHAQGRHLEACKHHEAALAIATTLGNPYIEGALRCNLGISYGRLDRAQEGRTQCEAAIAIAREVGDRRIEGIALDALASIGVLCPHRIGPEETRSYIETALAIHREMGNQQREGAVFCNLGIICYRQGRMEEARGHFETALAILRKVNDARSVSITLANLGLLNQDQGRMAEARAQYEEALDITRRMGNRAGEGEVLGNFGLLDLAESKLGDARSRTEDALAISRDVGDRALEAKALIALGSIDLEARNTDRGRARAEEALAIAHERSHPELQGLATCLIGQLDLAQGRIDEARDALDRAEVLLRSAAPLSVVMGSLLCARARLEHRTGNARAARKAIDEASAIAARFGTGSGSWLGVRLAITARTVMKDSR